MLIYKKVFISYDPLVLFIFSNYMVKNSNDAADNNNNKNKSRWSAMSPGR